MCPLQDDCKARMAGKTASIPAPKPKRKRPTRETHMLLIETPEREVLLERRPPQGIWGGLWSFPECNAEQVEVMLDRLVPNIQRASVGRLTAVNHGFTHYKLSIQPLHVKLAAAPTAAAETNEHRWFALDVPLEVGLARPVARMLESLRELPREDI